MLTTRPVVLDHEPAALDVLWHALDPDTGGPTVRIRAVMIASVDGTTTVDGRSGALGTPTDRLVYDAMRARADVILVGSGTALDESYGPAHIAEAWTSRRHRPAPPVVILTRSLPDRLIAHCVQVGAGVHIAAAATTPPDRIETAREAGVTVHVMDDGPYAAALRELLAGLGAGEVAFEGGPHLLGRFLDAGLVDELVLSVAPEIIVGGASPGLVSGPTERRVPMRVAAAFSCPLGGLYTRWVVDPAPPAEPTLPTPPVEPTLPTPPAEPTEQAAVSEPPVATDEASA